MIEFFLRQRLHHVARFFKKQEAARLITVSLFFGILVLIGIGVYFSLTSGLGAVAESDFLRIGLPYFVYQVFLLTVLGLIFVSALITGLFMLFRNESDAWLLVSPAYDSLLFDKFISIALTSIWPLFIFAIPALLAMQTVFSIGFWGIVLGLVSVVLLSLLVTALAVLLILSLSTFVRYLGSKHLVTDGFSWLLGLTTSVVLVLAGLIWLHMSGLDLVTLFDVSNLDIEQADISNVSQYFSVFPSHMSAETLLAIQVGDLQAATSLTFLLAAITIAAIYFVSLFSRPFIYIWQYFREGTFEARTRTNLNADKTRKPSPFSANPISSVFTKERISMFRNKRTLFWIGFLTLLWIIVTSFDVFIQNSFSSQEIASAVMVPQFVQSLQIIVVGYFVAALVLRIVFPAFSMERDTAWSIITAPITLSRLFWTKAAFYVSTIAAISILIALLHVLMLSESVTSALLFILYVLVVSITLTLIGLGLGARFPNFLTDDPEELSTTLPGFGFVGISLLYGSLAAYSYYLVFAGVGLISLMLFLLFSICLAWAICSIALDKLPHTDFAARVES
ncbi:MAG: hypothetical protein WD335_03805 [Candidatus Paceibacterota bacterium]